MPLTAAALSSMTYASYIGLIPTAGGALRSNPATGVPAHSPPQRLINGLASGLVTTIQGLRWTGTLTGATDLPGNAAPTPFVFSGSVAATSTFLSTTGWVGPSSALVAQALIQSMLDNVAAMSLLQGEISPAIGTGSAVFDPGLNAALLGAAQSSLTGTLAAALQAEGVFGTDDVPGAPINPVLAAAIPAYASAYASGLASLTATVPYVGTGASAAAGASPVLGAVV